ncbi:unnamed protein product, partial [Adineta ricciae]
MELLKNRIYYDAQFSTLIGPFNEALRRACNNYSFCELYELVALANVLHCEIQCVYPYIDYRAEMKCMNAVYKPLDTSVTKNGRLVIFWTSTYDELTTRERPSNGGVWNPNHFVPLVQSCRSDRSASNEPGSPIMQTPRKQTIKNNQISSIRSPEFSPPPNARKHRPSSSSAERPQFNLETYDTQRKREERTIENEQQRKQRLITDRLRKRAVRENATEEQRLARLSADRASKHNTRENETEEQRLVRLSADRLSKHTTRENETEEQRLVRLSADRASKHNTREDETEEQRLARLSADRLSKHNTRENETEDQQRRRLTAQQQRSAKNRLSGSRQRSKSRTDKKQHTNVGRTADSRLSKNQSFEAANIQHEQQILQKDHQTLLNEFIWPMAVPTKLKNYCLQDFSNHMSMAALRQSTCILCNI